MTSIIFDGLVRRLIQLWPKVCIKHLMIKVTNKSFPIFVGASFYWQLKSPAKCWGIRFLDFWRPSGETRLHAVFTTFLRRPPSFFKDLQSAQKERWQEENLWLQSNVFQSVCDFVWQHKKQSSSLQNSNKWFLFIWLTPKMHYLLTLDGGPSGSTTLQVLGGWKFVQPPDFEDPKLIIQFKE